MCVNPSRRDQRLLLCLLWGPVFLCLPPKPGLGVSSSPRPLNPGLRPIMLPPPPNIYDLVPRTRDCVTLHSTRDLADVIQLRLWDGAWSGLFWWDSVIARRAGDSEKQREMGQKQGSGEPGGQKADGLEGGGRAGTSGCGHL